MKLCVERQCPVIFLAFLLIFSSVLNGGENLAPEQAIEKIELFLKNQVPGLSVSYRDVINAMIAKGMDVYIRGGVTRDIFDERSPYPHDVDLYYSGEKKDILTLLDENDWIYFDRPGMALIRIGDSVGAHIDASPAGIRLGDDPNLEEYTINNIIYHCNVGKFIGNSENGIEDIGYRRLRVISSEWNQWVLDDQGKAYKRLFRFWKMVGKGYVYSQQFENFISSEINRLLSKNKYEFERELRKYLSKDRKSYDEALAGCRSVMGYEWACDHMLTKEEVLATDEESQKLIVHHLAKNKESKNGCSASCKLSLKSIFRFFK